MEFIQQNLLLISLMVTSLGGFIFLTFKKGNSKNLLPLSQAILLINRENAQVIDIRTQDEYVQGHLPESRNFPLAHLSDRIVEISSFKSQAVILVCQSGRRAASTVATFEKEGFTKVHVLEGGIDAWRTDNLPLKKGAKK